MIISERMSKEEIKRSRKTFWIMWVLLVTIPANVIAFLFSYGTWWVSTLAIIIAQVIGHNVFEIWLKRRQKKADNTIVLCYCAHGEGIHHDTLGMCQHYTYRGRNEIGPKFTRCLCDRYTPRFWRMAERT